MRNHELRRSVVGETHLRRWPQVKVPSRIVQWVAIVPEGERATEFSAIDAKSDHQRTNPADHVGVRFVWKLQSEPR